MTVSHWWSASLLERLELRSFIIALIAVSSLASLAASLVSLKYLSAINLQLQKGQVVNLEVKIELERTAGAPAVKPLYGHVWECPDKLKSLEKATSGD